MLESLVASILNRILGSYVENFDPKQLQIGLLGGDVKLERLQLKQGALDQLQLPIQIVNGHIGSLILQIPYSNLKSKPVKVFIEDVFLIAKPELGREEEGQKRREQAAKLDKLQLWELSSERAMSQTAGNAGASSDSDKQLQQNFTSSLVTKIVENVQVTIRNIHVRFEDLDVGLAMGATLGELSAISTNKDWEPGFIADVGPITHKLATLDSLAFYIDTDLTSEFSTAQSMHDKEKLLEEFKQFIYDNVGVSDVLRPINGQGFITMNKKPQTEQTPRVKADLKFEELSVNLDRAQYIDALRLIDQFQKYFNSLKYRKRRPSVTVKEDPLAWFSYAANTVLDGVREQRRQWTWEAMKQHLDDQKKYIELYKKWYRSGSSDQGLTNEERVAFNDIQTRNTYDSIVFFRSLAKKELVKERRNNVAKPQSNQTWTEWLWGAKTSTTPSTATTSTTDSVASKEAIDSAAPIEITEEQRQELLDVLDEPTIGEESTSQVLLSLDFSLRSAGVRIKNSNMAIASAGFEGVKANFVNKPNSFAFEMSVTKFEVTDLARKNQFSDIIRVHDGLDGNSTSEPFFWLFFEHHPPDKVAESNLFVKSQSVVMVHNARLLETIIEYFSPPPDQGDTVDAILLAANKTVEELREQTRIGLEYALENHKTLNLKLDIKAPTIVIPLDTNDKDSAALVLDVGSLQMASDLVPQNVLSEVKSKQALKYSESDWKRLESLMYDRFTVKLCDTQILLGERMSDITKRLGQDSSQMHFLDKATLQFLIQLSIVPRNHNLTKSKISIQLPNLRATLSDVHYLLFMKILAAANPHTDTNNKKLPERAPSKASNHNKVKSLRRFSQGLLEKPWDKEVSEGEESNATADTTTTADNNKELQKKGNEPQSLPPQRIFEFSFVVNEVHFYVVKGWDARPLIDMCLHELKFTSWSNNATAKDSLGVDLSVRDLLLTDHTNPSGDLEFRKLAESAGHDDDTTSQENDLFSVEFRKSSDGDMWVEVNLAKIRFNLNPDTVLAIYDYVMSTFTSPSENSRSVTPSPLPSSRNTPEASPPSSSGSEESLEDISQNKLDSNRIKVRMNLHGVSALIVENNEPVVNLAMEKAQLNVDMKDAMKVQFMIGALSVVDKDKNDLVSIEGGDNLVDCRYETEPLQEGEVVPTLPSLVYLRMGQVKARILEEPLTQLVSILNRFTVMKAAYDQARLMAFDQAIQVEPGKFKFDVIISTPIIFWPRGSDWVRLDLGEVYVQNHFKGTANDLTAGIRHVQITSSIDDIESQIVPKTDFQVNLSHVPDSDDIQLPITRIKASLTPIHVKSSEHQYKLILEFLKSLSTISAGTASASIGMDEVGNLRRRLAKEKKIGEKQTSYWWGENFSVSLGEGSVHPAYEKRPKLMFEFEAPQYDITLDLEGKPLSRFAINEVFVEVSIDKSSDMEATFYLKSFAMEDLGSEKNKFTQIIPPIKHDGHQIMGRVLQRKNAPLKTECSIDSPQVILALEYLLALKKFLDKGSFPTGEADNNEEEEEEISDDGSIVSDYTPSVPSRRSVTSRTSLADADLELIPIGDESRRITPEFCINVVDMFLTVLADENDENSEAIVFKIEHFVLNIGLTSSVTISKVGMFLTRMQTFEESHLRILDDFNVAGSMDNSESTQNLRLTNVQASMDPLVLRISLREIELMMGIAARASKIWATENAEGKAVVKNAVQKKATNFFADDHRVAKSGKKAIKAASNDSVEHDSSEINEEYSSTLHVTRVLAEQLTAQFEGIRVVFIDPVHQLPMSDFCIKPFSLVAKNWSDSLVISAKAEFYANVHSFTKSAWEPLVDTMEIGLMVTGDAFELNSSNVANIELTPETIDLFHDIQKYFNDKTSQEYQVMQNEEGFPYRIRNKTGVPITIWADTKSSKSRMRKIADGEEIKWSFHDWRELRENLNATEQDNTLNIEFEGEDYELLNSVPINRIGEHLFVVNKNGEKVRLVLDIWIENHLKYITIRSTEYIRNHTGTALEVMLFGPDRRQTMKLAPHSAIAVPLYLVDSRILVRRENDEQWPNKSLYWKELLDGRKLSLECAEDFYITVHPEIPDVPLSQNYPYLSINLAAPYHFVNNLPHDLTLRLYNRELKREIHRDLPNAGRVLLHDFSEENLLLMRVDLEGFTCNKFAIVNTGTHHDREFHVEDSIEVTQGRQRLHLMLDYFDPPNGEGHIIALYSPYVILNSTEKSLAVSDQHNRIVCPPLTPSLWSFRHIGSHDATQRVSLSTKDSQPSAPVSLDASGSANEVVIMSRNRQKDYYLGVVVTQGAGRYVKSKIVTVTPRFILWNALDRPLLFREPGGNQELCAEPGKRIPVEFIAAMANKEICTKFGDTENAEWSSSFAMFNIGVNYVRVSERGKPTTLVKIDVILEGASLFVQFTKSTMWPYSIRNFTDQEFVFYQSDPLVDEDGVELKGHADEFTPITYRLPPKSAMPYSWDFPAAKVKQLVLEVPQASPRRPARPPALPSRPTSSPPYSDSASSSRERLGSSAASLAESVLSNSTAASSSHRGRRIRRRFIQLAEIGELPPANFGNTVVVDLSVIADGPQQALVIAPHSPDASNYDVKTNKVKAEALEEMEAIDASTGRTLRLNLKGIGISCIMADAQELLYITMRNVKVSHNISDALETVSLQVQWIQVDNMLPGSKDFPVIIYPTVLPKAAAELAAHPCFSASITRVRDDSYGLTYIKHATILLQEMTIEADEDFLLSLADLVITLVTRRAINPNDAYRPLIDDNSALCQDEMQLPEPSTNLQCDDIYFEQLHLQPIQLNLSFMRTGSLSSSAIFKDNNVAGSLAFLIDALTLTIGNINDAPLRFNALLVDNVRTEKSTLAHMIQVHYQQEFVYQIHKIVGSADIIGNPVGLFNNISSGVLDLFYEPYLGYTLNDRPREFGVGLAKGGLSFMKKSVFGVTDSVSKFTGALSKGLSAMTLDSRFQSQHRARRSRNRPKHAIYGFKYGVESLYESLSSGFIGLAEAPMQGAVTDGGAGFFRGLGAGLIGLPTKTTIGLLDFASNLTEGIRNTTTVFDEHEISRVRLPRVIASDGVVRPYNMRESIGQMVLHSVKDSRYAKDRYLAHSNITKNKIVVVSMERIIVANMSDMSLEWSLTYDQVESISMEATGIDITLLGGAAGPFIPLSEESARQYIYKNIAKGVDNHNRRKITMG